MMVAPTHFGEFNICLMAACLGALLQLEAQIPAKLEDATKKTRRTAKNILDIALLLYATDSEAVNVRFLAQIPKSGFGFDYKLFGQKKSIIVTGNKMSTLLKKRIHQIKCDCGKAVAEGSVFCLCCRAAIKRKNIKILSREKLLFTVKR
jgi:hypothetical protein